MITERAQPDNEGSNPFFRPLSRRNILGVGSGLAATLLAATVSDAQQRTKTQEEERDHSASNPGPENRTLLAENPGSNMPPATDQGDVGPIWYSFDLALPSSKDLAGVNMRLTAGSFRELHWRLPMSGQSCSAATPASAF
jgi:oxalate decarboxylase